jgi:hypothetical protein
MSTTADDTITGELIPSGEQPAAPPPPNPKQVLRSLLDSQPHDAYAGERGRNEQVVRTASRVTRALVERTFAAQYIASGFSVSKAYQAIRPNASARRATIDGARFLAHPSGRVAALINAAMKDVAVETSREMLDMVKQIKADCEADIFDYIEKANVPVVTSTKDGPMVEYIEGFRFNLDPTKYTKLQRRGVRMVTIKQGEVTSIALVDKVKSRDQLIALFERIDAKAIVENSRTSGGTKKLRAAIERSKRLSIEAAKRLPLPKNVAALAIVDGKIVTGEAAVRGVEAKFRSHG